MTLLLPYPPSANRYLRHTGHGTYRTGEANRYRSHARTVALAAGVNLARTGPVEIAATLHPRLTKSGEASGVCLDLDNCLKVALDALQGVAFDNDRQVRRITLVVGDPVTDGGLSLEVSRGPL